MPRASDGTYTLPPGTLVNTGDTILTSQHNPPFEDVASALTNSLDRNGSGGMRASLNMNNNTIQNLSPGVNATDAATVAQLEGGAGAPTGSVSDFAGSTPPTGWLLCGGQAVSRTTFSDLFAVIGTTYGVGDGTTTFNVPDCRGRVTAGVDFAVNSATANRLTATTVSPNGTTSGATGGGQTHTLTTDEMPSHGHTLSGSTASGGDHSHTVSVGTIGGGPVRVISESADITGTATTSTAGAHTHTLSGSAANTGGGGAHNNVQPVILFNKIIKS